MSASDIIAIASAAIAALGLFLAAIQYLEGKRRTETERERLAAQNERLKTAITAASVGASSADLIVQRAKENDATVVELQNLARLLRGNLSVLAQQLQDERQEVVTRASADRSGASGRDFRSTGREDVERLLADDTSIGSGA